MNKKSLNANLNLNNNFSINSSESVGKGHPDKICDQIADYILDACLKKDLYAKVACEVMASNKLILIGGEITTTTYVDVIKAAWDVLLKIGYNENDFTIISNVNKQSEDISQSVIKDKAEVELGSGDQGIVYGYACDETSNYMPLSFNLATRLVEYATKLVDEKKLPWAKYDMKSLVSLVYDENNQPKIQSVIFSIQHDEKVSNKKIQQDINDLVLTPILVKEAKLNADFKKIINSSGRFIIGGPIGDTGLTNRKLMVDSYGGLGLHGGGGYSGKDPSKVDRSGAYFARWISKNLVAAKICKWVEVKLVYALGLSEPVNISLRFNADCKYTHDQLIKAIKKVFPMKLAEIVKVLKLREPQYLKTATFGHFGKNASSVFLWEKTNKTKELINELKK